MKILHLDSSITGKHSVSRTLSSDIVAAHVAQHPGAEVTYRDLANDPVLHLSAAHLAVFQGGQVESAAFGQDLADGARYLDELFAADVLVLGTPMYNLGIPRSSRPGSTGLSLQARPSAIPNAAQKVFCLPVRRSLSLHQAAVCTPAIAPPGLLSTVFRI
jgi:Flavodoxin-like fold